MSSKKSITVTVGVIALIGVAAVVQMNKDQLSAQLENVTSTAPSAQDADAEKSKEAAAKIISEVRKLIDIPEDIDPTVATIIDIELLREKNPFYSKAENGDHLVVTPTRAILYSSAQNKILDVVPVQLQPTEGGSE